MWKPDNSNGNEVGKIRWDLVEFTRGRGLDIGCGPNKGFPHFIGIDSNKDEALFGIRATGADMIVPDASKLELFASATMDFVFSSHLLEHIVDHKAALDEWWRVVKVGGHLVLYLPHKDLYPNIGTPGANPDHKHDFVEQDIIDAMADKSWDLLRCEQRNEGDEYSFFMVFKRLADGAGQLRSFEAPRPEKTCAVVRYGAYGDVMQAVSVLPLLKQQGFHVTFYCVPRGLEILREDPHIDKFIQQDEEQVPNHLLGDFFHWMAKRYDRLVNFCGVVEGMLLPDSGHVHFHWAHDARHAICNRNYVELMHELAQVPYDRPLTQFYPTFDEEQWALEQRAQIKGPAIVWSLSGSSAHKIWPHVDAIVARLMLHYPKAEVVVVGAAGERPLMDDWKNERRVHNRCGDWSIRQTLAFARVADIVVGPETGVLNAVAMEDVVKILFLSHSSVVNLCRDWKNTHAFAAEGLDCYPCHRLHREGFKYCRRHEEGCAVCQQMITADDVWPAFEFELGEGQHGLRRLQA